jgi:hypothetical protein
VYYVVTEGRLPVLRRMFACVHPESPVGPDLAGGGYEFRGGMSPGAMLTAFGARSLAPSSLHHVALLGPRTCEAFGRAYVTREVAVCQLQACDRLLPPLLRFLYIR